MKKKTRKVWSVLLLIAMLFTILPPAAFAQVEKTELPESIAITGSVPEVTAGMRVGDLKNATTITPYEGLNLSFDWCDTSQNILKEDFQLKPHTKYELRVRFQPDGTHRYKSGNDFFVREDVTFNGLRDHIYWNEPNTNPYVTIMGSVSLPDDAYYIHVYYTTGKYPAGAAPTGLKGVNPTIPSKENGKITGVSTEMEYSDTPAFPSYRTLWCKGDTITGLKAGTYYVRYHGDENHDPSKYTEVVVPPYDPSLDHRTELETLTVKNFVQPQNGTTVAAQHYIVKETNSQIIDVEQINMIRPGSKTEEDAMGLNYVEGTEYIYYCTAEVNAEESRFIPGKTTVKLGQYTVVLGEENLSDDLSKATFKISVYPDSKFLPRSFIIKGVQKPTVGQPVKVDLGQVKTQTGLSHISYSIYTGSDGWHYAGLPHTFGDTNFKEEMSYAIELKLVAQTPYEFLPYADSYDIWLEQDGRLERMTVQEAYRDNNLSYLILSYCEPVRGVSTQAPSRIANDDGKLIGTMPAMEWDNDPNFTHPRECALSETVVGAPGTYYVRYSKSGPNTASNPVRFVVPAYEERLSEDIVLTDITAPKTGETPDLSASVEPSDRITVKEITWEDSLGDAITGEMVYKPGQVYTVTVQMEAKQYYKFESATVTLNGKDANFKVSPNGKYIQASYTFDRTEKKSQNVPTGLKATAPSEVNGSDGKITETTPMMEYRKVGDTRYQSCNGNEITDLTAGEYQVRYAATAEANPSPDASVTVPNRYGITVETEGSGTVTGQPTSALVGEEVTLTAKPNDGQKFVNWIVTPGYLVDEQGITNKELSFTMPNEAVTVKAVFAPNAVDIKTVNLTAPLPKTGNTLNSYKENNIQTDSNQYTVGFLIWDSTDSEFQPNTSYGMTVILRAADGYRFTESTTYCINNEGLSYFDMGETTATLKYTFDPTEKNPAPKAPENLTGTAPTTAGGTDGKIQGTTKLMEYATNMDFSGAMTCEDKVTEGLAAGTYYVRVKETETTLAGLSATVVIPKRFAVSVSDDGHAKTTFLSHANGALEGEKVTIKATPDKDYEFDHWQVEGGNVTLEDGNKAETTFIMGTENVAVKAYFRHKIAKIKKADLTITAPKRNEKPATVVTVTGTAFDAGTPEWKPVTEVFGPNTVYTVTIRLQTKDYQLFDKQTVFTLNGNPATGVVLEKGKEAKVTYEFPATEKNPAPKAPENLTGIAPTTVNGTGKIQGTTKLMEYATSMDFSGAMTCGDKVTEGLAAGTYYVRVKETETTLAGLPATVVIPKRFAVSVSHDGHGTVTLSHENGALTGEKVTIKATPDKDYEFDHWQVEGRNVTLEDGNKAETTFTMGTENVAVKAYFRHKITKIQHAAISIDAPILGQKPLELPVSTTSQFDAEKLVWDPTVETFGPNTVYSVTATLKAVEHHVFDADTEFTLNGNTVTAEISENGQTAVITYTFQNATGKYPGAEAPKDLEGVAPTTRNGSDGKILHTTKDMEYATQEDFSDAKDCGDKVTKDLAAGTYYVRIKGNDTTNPGHAVKVKVPEYKRPSSGGGGGSITPSHPPFVMIMTIDSKLVIVNGKVESNDVPPVIRDSRTFTPSRFVAEKLGAKVVWKEADRTVTITKNNTTIVLTIDSKTAYVNGKAVQMDVAPFIENSRTYTPSRFVAEALGAKVDWNEETRKVFITK